MDSSNRIAIRPNIDVGLGIDTIIVLLAVGGIIFGSFYLLKKYIIPILETRKIIRKTKLLIFRIELIVWLLFVLVALTQFFTQNVWVTSALLIVIGLVGLNFWKDFFPGLLIRSNNKIKKNDRVRFENYSGTIKFLGKTSIHIKTEDEELIYIPYRKINDGIFAKRQAKGKLMSSKIVLHIGNKNPELVIDKVNKWIKECPWAIPQSKNNLSIQPGGLLNITVYAVDDYSLGKVERYLKQKIESIS